MKRPLGVITRPMVSHMTSPDGVKKTVCMRALPDVRRGGELAVALGHERRVDFLLPPPGAEHHRVLGEELRCQLHGRAYLATGVPAEVQDELGGALAPKPLEGVMHLGRSLFSEL